jgi:peptide/nickel transport system ATP-binding protein
MSSNSNTLTTKEPVLKVKNLFIKARRDEHEPYSIPIVNDVSFNLNPGEIIGLIGESGAGKSTIGMACLGYCRPGCAITGGEIIFDGRDICRLTPSEKRALRGIQISYVAQSAAASFNPAHTLMQQFCEVSVQHGVASFKEAHKKAVELYRDLELPYPESIGNRYPHQVSGGQLQRAMVAMAMACEPKLIVFDEPTTALDVTTQIEVLATIKRVIKKHNTAAIYITHDLAVVVQLSDHIMVLRYGDMVEEGPAQEILDHPKEQYTYDLLSSRKQNNPENTEDKGVVLQIKNLSAGYMPGVPVVKDVTMSLSYEHTVAIVGESGSGKSSLARAIVGLLPRFKGDVVLKGEELPAGLKGRSKDQLRRMQMIYQMPDIALNPRQKVKKILGRPLDFYFGLKGKEKTDRIAELLAMTELPSSYMGKYPRQLSGGEKQRICIARALAAEPDLIICDEITSALDQLVAAEILKLLVRLQNETQAAYIFITHDLSTVRAIADEVVVMLEGEVVEKGRKAEIFSPPHHEYTKLLLESVPEMDSTWLDNLLYHREKTAQAGT